MTSLILYAIAVVCAVAFAGCVWHQRRKRLQQPFACTPKWTSEECARLRDQCEAVLSRCLGIDHKFVQVDAEIAALRGQLAAIPKPAPEKPKLKRKGGKMANAAIALKGRLHR